MATMKKAAAAKPGPFAEIGITGLKRTGTLVLEEWVPELKGQRGMKVFREMQDNHAAVGGTLGLIEALLRQVSWMVEPPKAATQEELSWTDHINSCLHDMSFSWSETLSEILSMLVFGFAPMEIVYKNRRGDVNDPSVASRYTDGLVGWRKLAIRAQETVFEWKFDDHGGIQGLVQQALPDFRRRDLAIEKLLLFRPKLARNNPEGRSILRSAYRSYYYWKRTLEIEGIGIEREIAGMPVMYIPAACMMPDATPEQKAVFESAKALVTGMRTDDLMGAVVPLDYEPGSNAPRYKLELLSTGGERAIDTTAVIDQRNREIVLSMIYDLLIMGQPNSIQYKGKNMPEFFSVSLSTWLDSISDVMNGNAIPRLYRMNGWPTERMGQLKHGEVAVPDLAAMGDYISKLTGAKALFPDNTLEDHLRRLAGLPDRDEKTVRVGPAGGPDNPPPADDPGSNPDKDK